jgi:hypothetical protein
VVVAAFAGVLATALEATAGLGVAVGTALVIPDVGTGAVKSREAGIVPFAMHLHMYSCPST